MIQETITHFLERHQISKETKFMLAISGGADSICLLHAFKYLNLKIWVLHCNFSLRGKESDMDEQFVKRFCEKYGIPHSVHKFDTLQYAKEKGISIEMAARELRYNWFHDMLKKKKMDYIVVAHHADDIAETLLINLCRGTGIKGLTGIKPINGQILRPLLECSRTDILQYIETHQLGFRTDSTNNSLDYIRNKIRHQIIPIFKEINSSFLETIKENCTALKETEEIFNYGIQELQEQILDCEDDEILIHIKKTLASPAPYTLLYETLKPFGFNKTQIKNLLHTHNSIPGKQFIAKEHTLVRGRHHWRLYHNSKQSHISEPIETAGEYSIAGNTFKVMIFPRPENFEIPKDPTIACLDGDKIKFPLTIRNWQAGDYFCPIGMKRSKKKISDFLVDQKISSKQKQQCLLLVSDDQICWVINYRLDERFKITSFTKKIVQIQQIKKRS